MKKLKMFMAMVLTTVLLAGCASTPASPEGEKPTSGEKLKVTHIVRSNLGDLSFNDSAWAGVQKAGEELGMEVNVIEIGGDQTKYEPTILDASVSDADIIIVNSGALSEAAEQHVRSYPDKKYIFFDVQPTFDNQYDNVLALSFKQNESSYLAGSLAGLMTKTNNIGFVGGTENIIINDFMVGYINGAIDSNKDIKVQTALIGNTTDTARAKELGLVQINNGADFIHSVAGGAGLGVIDAVYESGDQIWSLGVDSDQAMKLKPTAPEKADRIITSALKDVGSGLYNALKLISEGKVEWGTLQTMGVAEGVTGIAINEYYEKHVPAEVKAKMKEITEKIAKGEIVVPTAFEMNTEQINTLKDSVRP